ILGGLGIFEVGERETEVEIALENIGLDVDRMAIGGGGLGSVSLRGFHVAEVVPGAVILGIGGDGILQKRFGFGPGLFFDGGLGLVDGRGLRRFGSGCVSLREAENSQQEKSTGGAWKRKGHWEKDNAESSRRGTSGRGCAANEKRRWLWGGCVLRGRRFSRRVEGRCEGRVRGRCGGPRLLPARCWTWCG